MNIREYLSTKREIQVNFDIIRNIVAYLNREIRVDQIETVKVYDIRNREDGLRCIESWNENIDKINKEINCKYPSLECYKVQI